MAELDCVSSTVKAVNLEAKPLSVKASDPVVSSSNCLNSNGSHVSSETTKADISQMGRAAIPRLQLPSTQSAVVSPIVGKQLDQHLLEWPIREPKLGEVVVRVAWTGICGSVS